MPYSSQTTSAAKYSYEKPSRTVEPSGNAKPIVHRVGHPIHPSIPHSPIADSAASSGCGTSDQSTLWLHTSNSLSSWRADINCNGLKHQLLGSGVFHKSLHPVQRAMWQTQVQFWRQCSLRPHAFDLGKNLPTDIRVSRVAKLVHCAIFVDTCASTVRAVFQECIDR